MPNPNIKKLKWKVSTRSSRATHRTPFLIMQITESPSKIDDLDKLDWMQEPITNPPVSRIDLKFPQSLTLTVRKPKGVTVKDAMDTIYKKFKHKALEVSLTSMM